MSLHELSGPSNRSLLLVHGRDFKPGPETYMDVSMAAMRAGIERDYADLLDGFDLLQKHLAWYGDLSAEVLTKAGKKYDPELDLGDRRNALTTLREIPVRKRFGIRQYDCLPGKSAIPEFIADVTAPVLGSVGLTMPLVGSVAKDFAAYLNPKLDYGERARERVRNELCPLMDRGDRIILVTHGTGSVIAYDVLWQLSHDARFVEKYGESKVELWITLGSPLGDRNIRKRLLGAREKSADKFPANVISWHNVAAEDDYTCHDNTLADDFRKMLRQRVVSSVKDYRIFNLAVRYGRSNPHSSVGYYIHPRTSKILADWLQSGIVASTPRYTF